jgi:hypothetical protein
MLNEPRREHSFPCIAQGKEKGAPEIPVAKEIRRDGCSHGADNDRPSRPGPERDQDTGGHTCGRPENGNALWFGQQSKAKSRCYEIYDADRDSEPNPANPPRQVDAGGQLMLNLSS